MYDPSVSTKRVLIAHTGGTIGMRRGPRGYAPTPGFLAERLAAMPELSRPPLPQTELVEFDPLLDSSDVTPSDWERTAALLAERSGEFDGFVVLHGTDTMAYTASALSFLLEGWGKPVVLTGSQIPLAEVRSDARENLVTSLLLAAGDDLAEVCVYLNGVLLRGNRSTKVSTRGFDAFESPNEAPLGTVGIDITLRREALRPAEAGPVRVRSLLPDVPVASLRLFPGMRPQLLLNVLQPPLKGLVIETFGAGNVPVRDGSLVAVLKEATQRGIVIVNCTQCLRGRVDMRGYEGGNALAAAGVIDGGDMTAEAALAKLLWLLSSELPQADVARLMGENLRGELTTGTRSDVPSA